MQTIAYNHDNHDHKTKRLGMLLVLLLLLTTAFLTQEPVENVSAIEAGPGIASARAVQLQATEPISPSSAAFLAAVLNDASEEQVDFELERKLYEAPSNMAEP